jgi:hypothetical protein
VEDVSEEVALCDFGLGREEVVGCEFDAGGEMGWDGADRFGGAHSGLVLDDKGEVGEGGGEGEGDVALVAADLVLSVCC